MSRKSASSPPGTSESLGSLKFASGLQTHQTRRELFEKGGHLPFPTKGFQYREGKGEVVRRGLLSWLYFLKALQKREGGAGIQKGKSACCLMYENLLSLVQRLDTSPPWPHS